MHTYKWQDKYDVGIDAIDIEHRNLLTCINKLITAQTLDKSMILKLADEVYYYAEFHFISEENLMCLTHYPDLSKHSACHRVLLKELTTKKRYLEESLTGLQDYVSFLVKWFIEHTQTVDRRLGEYLRNYEPPVNSPEHVIQQLSLGKNKLL